MPLTIDSETRRLAHVLWDYHNLDLGLRRSDFALALGSHDERVALRAGELVTNDVVPLLVTSGGFGKVTQHIWNKSEGEHFAQIAISMGVPPSRILVENTATNTGENVTRSRDLLVRNGVFVSSGILVTKPYMRRRAYATASKQWPDVSWTVTSPDLSFEEYPKGEVTEERMIELMVGDLQRIRLYAEQGLQLAQNIPGQVWKSYEELVERGFSKYVI